MIRNNKADVKIYVAAFALICLMAGAGFLVIFAPNNPLGLSIGNILTPIVSAVAAWDSAWDLHILDLISANAVAGADGADGTDGIDGTNGANGVDGNDGIIAYTWMVSVWDNGTFYSMKGADSSINATSADSSALTSATLGYMTAGTLLSKDVAFDLALMNSIPDNVAVVESVNGLQKTYINPLDSQGSLITVSVSGVNYFAQDSLKQYFLTSTNASYIFNAVCNGGNVFVKDGTYPLTTKLLITQSHSYLIGESSRVLFTSSLLPAFWVEGSNYQNAGLEGYSLSRNMSGLDTYYAISDLNIQNLQFLYTGDVVNGNFTQIVGVQNDGNTAAGDHQGTTIFRNIIINSTQQTIPTNTQFVGLNCHDNVGIEFYGLNIRMFGTDFQCFDYYQGDMINFNQCFFSYCTVGCSFGQATPTYGYLNRATFYQCKWMFTNEYSFYATSAPAYLTFISPEFESITGTCIYAAVGHLSVTGTACFQGFSGTGINAAGSTTSVTTINGAGFNDGTTGIIINGPATINDCTYTNIVTNISMLAGGKLTNAPSLQTGLAIYLPMDENTGTATADWSGFNNNGALITGASWTTGKYGQGIDFNGINGTVSIPYKPQFALSTFSVSFWFNASSLSGWPPNTVLSTRSGGNTFDVGVTSGGYIAYDLGNATNWLANRNVQVLANFATNTWYFVTVVVTANKNVSTYYNGVLADTFAISGNPLFCSPTSTITIGQTESSQYFAGILDDVRVYSRALTYGDVTSIYNDGPLPHSGIV